jgi:hypothetical protein
MVKPKPAGKYKAALNKVDIYWLSQQVRFHMNLYKQLAKRSEDQEEYLILEPLEVQVGYKYTTIAPSPHNVRTC